MPRWFGAFALALVVLGLAGFSGSSWLYGAIYYDRLFTQEEIDRPGMREIWGTSRFIRSDEWGVETPQVRAQQLAGFPLVNLNEGIGELQRNTYDIPVFDWGLAFRPLTWPYLLPFSWSHGARWFLRDLMLLLGAFALLSAFVEDKQTAAMAAVALFFSSAFVWWRSTVMVEFMGMLCLTGGVAARAFRERSAPWFVLTAWCSACSFCVFYPPVWAPMLWVVCGVVMDAAWRRKRLGTGAVLVALIAGGAMVGVFYHLPYLSLVADTVYPGRRIVGSGEMSLGRWIEMVWPSLTASAPVRCGPERYLGIPESNVCEASSVEVVPLFVLPALALVSARVRRAFADLVRSSPASLVAFGILSAWLFLPLPQWFPPLTLLRWSPAARAWMAFGISVALLVSRLLASLRADDQVEAFRWRGLVGVAAVLASAFAVREHVRLDLVTGCYARAWWPPIVLAGVLLSAGSLLSGTRRGATLLLVAWMASVVLANHRVNPLVHSSQLFAEGEGHREIDRAIAQTPGRLLDYSTHFGAQLAAFGWPMLGGIQNAPQLALFRFLGQESPGLTEEVYNRYAHYSFELPPAKTRVANTDVIRVAISPCSRRLAALGVNHLLMEADAAPPLACTAEWIQHPAGQLRIWSRRMPVCAVGVADGAPASAVDYDYACPSHATFASSAAGFSIEVPADAVRSWAVSLNPAIVGAVDCSGATARFVDAHLVVHPQTGAGPASCRGRYLDSPVALRRLLKR